MRAAAVALCVLLAGCATRPEHTLPTLATVTRVDITRNDMHALRHITDPSRIAQLKSFVEERRAGWKEGFPDTPVPRLHAYFYNGPELVGEIGVGPGFFKTQRSVGLWLSRSATRDEETRFLQVIGMSHFDLHS
jgi:hypothetical protein